MALLTLPPLERIRGGDVLIAQGMALERRRGRRHPVPCGGSVKMRPPNLEGTGQSPFNYRRPIGGGDRSSHSPPQLPVETPEANGLGDVAGADLGATLQVGECPGDLEDPIVCPRGEVHVGHGGLEELVGGIVEPDKLPQLPRAHAGVAGNLSALESFALPVPGLDHTVPDNRAATTSSS